MTIKPQRVKTAVMIFLDCRRRVVYSDRSIRNGQIGLLLQVFDISGVWRWFRNVYNSDIGASKESKFPFPFPIALSKSSASRAFANSVQSSASHSVLGVPRYLQPCLVNRAWFVHPAYVSGMPMCNLLGSSIKATSDEALFLELAMRGYDLTKLQAENNSEVVKIA